MAAGFRRTIGLYFMAGTIGFVLAFMLGEASIRLYLRLTDFRPSLANTGSVFVALPGSGRGYGYHPGLEGLGTNSAGFRGPEFPSSRSPGEFRVIMLGDSITSADELPVEQTIPAALESVLRRARPGKDVRVFDLGVVGYNTWQERATLREVGTRLLPDLVVLNVCLNDSDPAVSVYAAGLRTSARIQSWSDVNLRTVVGVSYLLTFLKKNLAQQLRDIAPGLYANVSDPRLMLNRRVSESAWGEMQDEMLRIRDDVRATGADFLVVIYPFASQLALPEDQRLPQRSLAAFYDNHAIPYLDVAAAYEDPTDSMFVDQTLHLSAHGTEVIARYLAARIVADDMPGEDGQLRGETAPPRASPPLP